MNTTDKIILYKFLSRTLKQKLSIQEAMDLFSKESPLKHWRLFSKIEKGFSRKKPFSSILSDFPKIFLPFEIALIKTSESSNLAKQSAIFAKLAQIVYKNQIFKKRMRNLFTYPLLLLISALILMIILIFVLLPRFEIILNSFNQNQNLDLFLKFLFNLNHTARTFFSSVEYIVFLFLLLGILIWKFFKSQKMRIIIEILILNFPVSGNVLKKQEVARITFLWSEMLKNKIKKEKIFQTLLESTKWKIYQRILEKMSKKGKISEIWKKQEENLNQNLPLLSSIYKNLPLSIHSLYYTALPVLFRKFIELGERTKGLEDELASISAIYQDEIESDLKYALNFLEPFLIFTVALLVGLIAYAVYSAYWEMQRTILKAM